MEERLSARILSTAWPAVLEMALYMLIGLADVAFVGRMGAVHLAAVSLGGRGILRHNLNPYQSGDWGHSTDGPVYRRPKTSGDQPPRGPGACSFLQSGDYNSGCRLDIQPVYHFSVRGGRCGGHHSHSIPPRHLCCRSPGSVSLHRERGLSGKRSYQGYP